MPERLQNQIKHFAPIFTSLLCLLCFKYKSQCDTIYPKLGNPVPSIIEEIGEDLLTYKKINSAVTYTIHTTDVQKVVLKNGRTEVFSTTEKKSTSIEKPKPSASSKKNFSEADKTKIEKLVVECGRKIAICGIPELRNCASFIDWSITRRDIFNPDLIIIFIKVNYDRNVNTDTESFTVSLSLNEANKSITWRLLNASNDADEVSLLKCQKKNM